MVVTIWFEPFLFACSSLFYLLLYLLTWYQISVLLVLSFFSGMVASSPSSPNQASSSVDPPIHSLTLPTSFNHSHHFQHPRTAQTFCVGKLSFVMSSSFMNFLIILILLPPFLPPLYPVIFQILHTRSGSRQTVWFTHGYKLLSLQAFKALFYLVLLPLKPRLS